MVKEALDPLTEKERQIVQVVSLIDLQRHMTRYRWYGKGRKRKDRVIMGRVGAIGLLVLAMRTLKKWMVSMWRPRR